MRSVFVRLTLVEHKISILVLQESESDTITHVMEMGAGLDAKARDDICLTRRPSISEKRKDSPVSLNSSGGEEEPHQ